MKRTVTILSALALIGLAIPASAALRAPQVVVLGGTLQAYLNSVGESINVDTDQQDAQRWTTSVSNNSAITIQVELSGDAPNTSVGIYNASNAAPPLYLVFPGAATSGWFAVASFRPTPARVIVNLFDNTATLVGTSTYLGADGHDFGFYLQGPGGLFYSQDARNPGGDAQALAYMGTGANAGNWWLAWEDRNAATGTDSDFDDCVLFVESVNVTPTAKSSWGALKARFR
jgi:hypothetical protein